VRFVLYDLPPHAVEGISNALQANKAFLQLTPPPTQAQVIAQVASLTRQMNKLLRTLGGELQDIDDTAP
jgi:hypothetical protein